MNQLSTSLLSRIMVFSCTEPNYSYQFSRSMAESFTKAAEISRKSLKTG